MRGTMGQTPYSVASRLPVVGAVVLIALQLLAKTEVQVAAGLESPELLVGLVTLQA